MPFITEVYAREVLDSRGNPTVEVEVYTQSGGIRTRTSTIWSFNWRI